MTLGPLALHPVLLEKVWGGDALARFGFNVAAGAHVGEAWLVSDLRETAVSGAGGQAVQSPLAVPKAGAVHLGDLVDADAAELLGASANGAGGFPVLVKILDARENLSVQVHPSPAYASTHPEVRLKHECWHVLEAAPDAVLYLGVEPHVSREDVEDAVRDGTVQDLLVPVPARVGECHLLPSGLVHAMGAGVVVAEVQTASDTTFRLYDWTREYQRPPRQLHVAEALDAADLALRPIRRWPAVDPLGLAAVTSAFEVRVLDLEAGHEQPLADDADRPLLVLPLGAAAVVVRCGDLAVEARTSAPVLVPAGARHGVTGTSAASQPVLVVDVRGALAR